MRYLTFTDLQHPKPSDGRPAVPYSRVHLKRLIRDGKLAAVYIGTSLRVPEQSLEALLKAGARRPRGRGKK